MKKSELKNGMIVEYRVGDRRLVLDDRIIGENSYNCLEGYNEDLENEGFDGFNIDKIYTSNDCVIKNNGHL